MVSSSRAVLEESAHVHKHLNTDTAQHGSGAWFVLCGVRVQHGHCVSHWSPACDQRHRREVRLVEDGRSMTVQTPKDIQPETAPQLLVTVNVAP